MEIHIARNGKQSGPFSVEEVRRQLATGHLFPSDLAWTPGSTDWKPLSSFPEVATLQPQPGAAVSPLRALNRNRPMGSGVAPTEAPRTSGAAVASLILGILSMTIMPFLANIPGIICGHVARSNIRNSDGSLIGDGIATAGLVMSYIGLAFWVLIGLVILPILAGIALPVFGEVKLRGEETKSLSNAKQIGTACILYSMDHENAFPPKLDDLIPEYLDDRKLFTSTLSPGEPMAYTYYGGSSKDPADKVLLMSKFKDRRNRRIIIYVNGSGSVAVPPAGY